MKHLQLLAGAAMALTSAWVLAQDSPESLLPPGFDQPAPKAAPGPRAPAPPAAGGEERAPAPASAGQDRPRPTGSGGGGGGGASYSSAPASAGASPAISSVRIPSIAELEKMTPEEFDDALGIRPTSDMPAAARRSLKHIGVLAEYEGGLPAGSFSGQNASLVRAALTGNKGKLVSRWGHILLRRALASRLDAPADMNPADFAAYRAALLVRMGEGAAARALVQDVDAGNYSPDLTQAALDAYVATADITGMCPAVSVHGGARKDPQWQVLQSICAAFKGEGTYAMNRLDRDLSSGTMPKIDVLLAQKYAGAAGKTRRAVKIEWDGVAEMTPWRYALTIGVGLQPPAALMKNAGARYTYMTAGAPMLGLTTRAAAADRAAGAGILSSEAMVDLYSQIYADPDTTGDWESRANLLRDAYVGADARARLAAIQQLWNAVPDPLERYSRQVLTAYAAARLPATNELAPEAPDLIASMLAAGLDRNAMRWAPFAEIGSRSWALLAVAAPTRSAPVALDALEKFNDGDDSENARKSAFLLAGLGGLGRLSPETAAEFAGRLKVNLVGKTRWARAIDRAAEVDNQGLVALLAGLGMQGESWSKMTPLHLYNIVSALHRVGLEAEARMIAAEAIARG